MRGEEQSELGRPTRLSVPNLQKEKCNAPLHPEEFTMKKAFLRVAMGSFAVAMATAQTASAQVPARSFQRSSDIYNFTMAATSGPQRGEVIYYYKCWFCHNDFTRAAGEPAPSLKDLFERPRLMSGQAVNEETVAEKIRSGGPMMPAYRYSLSDQDMADLLSYFREGKCCFNEYEPPTNPRYRAGSGPAVELQVRNNLRGGPTGTVRSTKGPPLEGIMVQLISQASSIRTTVYSNVDGRYEFPKLPNGTYTLRIAKPLEFRPYRRESVQIDAATRLQEIVLERVPNFPANSEFLPPTQEIKAQLTGAEWLMNLPGTAQEKRTFIFSCNWCHSYQQVFRSRFDEEGWRLIVERMATYSRSILLGRTAGRETPEAREMIVKWLARVRGPGSEDPPLQVRPGPRGAATRVIVTEYELPRLMLATHDVDGDSQGHIWYTPHRSPYLGRLDPRTGIVREYRVPDDDRFPETHGIDQNALGLGSVRSAHPGTHGIWVDQNDRVWAGENWRRRLVELDPRTGEFNVYPDSYGCSLHPDGSFIGIGGERGDRAILKRDPKTGEILQRWPLKIAASTYNCTLSEDGRYWGGGTWRNPTNVVVRLDIQTGEVLELETRSPVSHPSRAGFDPQGNLWVGGKFGALIKLDGQKRRVFEYFTPTPYISFYEAAADKNGEVWAGENQGGQFVRFNPRTKQMIEYVLPEPYAHNRRLWFDNSTDPVSVWYADHNSYIVHIQPLE